MMRLMYNSTNINKLFSNISSYTNKNTNINIIRYNYSTKSHNNTKAKYSTSHYFCYMVIGSLVCLSLFNMNNNNYNSNNNKNISYSAFFSSANNSNNNNNNIYNSNNIPDIINGGCNTSIDINSSPDADKSLLS